MAEVAEEVVVVKAVLVKAVAREGGVKAVLTKAAARGVAKAMLVNAAVTQMVVTGAGVATMVLGTTTGTRVETPASIELAMTAGAIVSFRPGRSPATSDSIPRRAA